MNVVDYEKFTAQLQANLEADDRVLSLVALGSMADKARRDNYSDHDFYVVVQSGHQEDFRQNLSWLPNADQIVLQFRETAHGLKVMYANAHLVEFAIFDEDELRTSQATVYEVLLDRGQIHAIMPETLRDTAPERNYLNELLHALSLLQVGAGRYARGERLSGHIFIKSYALMHLLPVFIHYLETDQPTQLDPLDAFRRFSLAYPVLGRDLDIVLQQPPIIGAQALLQLIVQHLEPVMPNFPREAVATLEDYLARLLN